jgi:hypothetical protein
MRSPDIRWLMLDIASQYEDLARLIDEVERLFGPLNVASS